MASSSPRRKDFFEALGLAVTILSPPENAEPLPLAGEGSAEYTIRAACAKALASSELCANGAVVPGKTPAFQLDGLREGSSAVSSSSDSCLSPLVIAADTVVVVEGVIFGKPQNNIHALTMLRALRGTTHSVITGCALVRAGVVLRTFSVESAVTFWACSDALLEAYVQSGEPEGKAGGYAIQGKGGCLVEGIHGSWTNVVGLPLAEMIQNLLELNVIEPIQSGLPVNEGLLTQG